ncbi:30S ribosomal protein S3 [Candidatus Woesearchaeota archaeon]|nr:MAG: 30S ribosomal protein S3 [Candidatus Woesearchaeota archaeon]
MIERKFVAQKMKELLVQNFMGQQLGKGKYSYFEIKKTPLGEKIIIFTTRPGLIVGKKGENIKYLTQQLKTKFNMENPQIEVAEVYNPDLDAQTVAEQIVNVFERYGPKRFKAIGYKSLQRIIDAGAMGAEIVISGRGVPSSRAKTWRFYAGYLKKSGDISQNKVVRGESVANLKSGSIGIKVAIMHPDIVLPDRIEVHKPEDQTVKIEAVTEEKEEEEAKEDKPKKAKKKKVKESDKSNDSKSEKAEEVKENLPESENKEESKVKENGKD